MTEHGEGYEGPATLAVGQEVHAFVMQTSDLAVSAVLVFVDDGDDQCEESVSAGEDGALKRWDLATGSERVSRASPNVQYVTLALSSGDKVLAAGKAGVISLIAANSHARSPVPVGTRCRR